MSNTFTGYQSLSTRHHTETKKILIKPQHIIWKKISTKYLSFAAVWFFERIECLIYVLPQRKVSTDVLLAVLENRLHPLSNERKLLLVVVWELLWLCIEAEHTTPSAVQRGGFGNRNVGKVELAPKMMNAWKNYQNAY